MSVSDDDLREEVLLRFSTERLAEELARRGFLLFAKIDAVNQHLSLCWHAGAPPWSLSDWATALVGEIGEACNVIKKLNRIRDGIWKRAEDTEPVLKVKLAYELADSQLYLMLLANAAGVNLELAVKDKFNEISNKFGFPERL